MNDEQFLERFDEIFEFDFGRSSVVRAGNQFIDYSNCATERQPFKIRLFIERIWTCTLLIYQEHLLGRNIVNRLATRYEDRDLKIDYFNADDQPIGHKIRSGHIGADGTITEMDAICVRFQPCHGIGHPDTKDGRDFECLVNRSTIFTKTAVFDKESNLFSTIHEFSSDEFLDLVLQLDRDWGFEPLSFSQRRWVHPNGSTVQWVKKEANFHKYIYYIPFRLFTESHRVFNFPREHGEELKRLHRMAWDYVVGRYINF